MKPEISMFGGKNNAKSYEDRSSKALGENHRPAKVNAEIVREIIDDGVYQPIRKQMVATQAALTKIALADARLYHENTVAALTVKYFV